VFKEVRGREVGVMLRRTTLVFVVLTGLVVGAVGSAFGTGASGVTAETASGPLVDRPLSVNMQFDDAANSSVKLKTKGNIVVAAQRIVAQPSATFGWHSHPGPTIVTVLSGTLTLYHAEDCTEGIDYAAGTSFSNLPHEIHLARNESTSQPLVIYASYFVPAGTPSLRIDQPSPGAECPL
jgi:quercetin dioxygenase-like cupin family protein